MKYLFLIQFALFFSCQTKKELAAPAPSIVDNYVGHWTKATILYSNNIEYIISKSDTTYSVNEIVSCKGNDCSKVKPSNLVFSSYFDKSKNHLKVFKEGKFQPFSYDNGSGWLFVDGFSYIKIK